VAAERLFLVKAIFPEAVVAPPLILPDDLQKPVEAEEATVTVVRGRLEISGPVTAQKMSEDLGLSFPSVQTALARLEAEGFALQGRYTHHKKSGKKESQPVEWCERRLLARIHRLTLAGARKRIQPVAPEQYWLYLAEYHHLFPDSHRENTLGLREALGQLQGFEMPAGAWEMDILASRVEKYQSEWLDQLSYSGELVWGRLRAPHVVQEEEPSRAALTRVVPISLAFREDLPWLLPIKPEVKKEQGPLSLRPEARTVYAALQQQGALFMHDLAPMTGFVPTRLQAALSELAAQGLVTADGFAALRALTPARKWEKMRRRSPTGIARGMTYGTGGRWTLFPGRVEEIQKEERVQQWALQLLRRYGIVFRDLLARETVAPAWWELVSVYRRMEARGEIRGGRFVAAVGGEQYALPEAVEALRRPRGHENSWLVISAADPLNLLGIVLTGARIPALRGSRLLFHNGRLVASLQGGELKFWIPFEPQVQEKIARALRLTQLPNLREEILKELSVEVPST
jgi:ATP-dependent Lhr-like helicase